VARSGSAHPRLLSNSISYTNISILRVSNCLQHAHQKIRRGVPPARPAVIAARAGPEPRPLHRGSIRIFAPSWCPLRRRPGEAISEAEIALAYGVSRTPVREAILKLSDEGLVEIFSAIRHLGLSHSAGGAAEAIIIRKALEETTARLAAERCHVQPDTPVCVRSWSASARLIPPRTTTLSITRTRRFHATIAEVAKYPGIWRLIQQVKIHVDRYRRLTLPQSGRMAQVIAEHEAILTAIEAHGSPARWTAMERHLERLLADISATQNINPEFFDQKS